MKDPYLDADQMNGPKHLWSGNWEEDSSSAPDELTPRHVAPRPPAPVAPPAQPKTPEQPARRRMRGPAWVALGAIILVAVAGAAVLTSGGSSPKHHAAAVTPTIPAPSLAATTPTTTQPPTPSSPPVSWLGMELVTVPPGGATVETLKLGSEGDQAGLSPGDVILEINNHPVTGAGDIAKAISGEHTGDKVALQISHGSSLFQTVVTLGASPTRYP
jgi:membrane-associated protease RseP (regulator of RpoE activity)